MKNKFSYDYKQTQYDNIIKIIGMKEILNIRFQMNVYGLIMEEKKRLYNICLKNSSAFFLLNSISFSRLLITSLL